MTSQADDFSQDRTKLYLCGSGLQSSKTNMMTDNNGKLAFSSHNWFSCGMLIMYMHGITFFMHPIYIIQTTNTVVTRCWFIGSVARNTQQRS